MTAPFPSGRRFCFREHPVLADKRPSGFTIQQTLLMPILNGQKPTQNRHS